MAVVAFYLKVDGIEGECQEKGHKNEIDLISWEWGTSRSMRDGQRMGAPAFQDFVVTKKIDKSSPLLFKASTLGTAIPSVVLTCLKSGGYQNVEYMKIKLTDALITSYRGGGVETISKAGAPATVDGGAGGDVLPTDVTAFGFGKIEFEYNFQLETGGKGGVVTHLYDLRKGQ